MTPMRVRLLAAIATLAAACGSAVACGFHPGLKGGLSVTYPGSLRVAVAVAEARRRDLLPPASPRTSARAPCFVGSFSARGPSRTASEGLCAYTAALLRLHQLKLRLEQSMESAAEGAGTEFSLVLVGPRLWSHYRLAADVVLARHHVDGPIRDRAVVLTHEAVLEAVLAGALDAGHAMEAGLIAVAGPEGARVSTLLVKAMARS